MRTNNKSSVRIGVPCLSCLALARLVAREDKTESSKQRYATHKHATEGAAASAVAQNQTE